MTRGFGKGWQAQGCGLKGLWVPIPLFAPAPELPGLERRIILNIGVRWCRCLATPLLPASCGGRWRFREPPEWHFFALVLLTQHLRLGGLKLVLTPRAVPAVRSPTPAPPLGGTNLGEFFTPRGFSPSQCCCHFRGGFPNDHCRILVSAKS